MINTVLFNVVFLYITFKTYLKSLILKRLQIPDKNMAHVSAIDPDKIHSVFC